jgi:hypothetical protein
VTIVPFAPVRTIDVSRPRSATWTEKAAGAFGDLGLAVLMALMLPLGLIVFGAPLVLVVWAILAIVSRV